MDEIAKHIHRVLGFSISRDPIIDVDDTKSVDQIDKIGPVVPRGGGRGGGGKIRVGVMPAI